jgi:hypothetical protein
VRDSTTHANYPHDTISVRLNVDTVTFPSQGLETLAGFLSYGGAFYAAYPDTPVGLRFGFYPYTQRPDSLIFDYKYIPAPGDNGSAYVGMTMNRYDSAQAREIIYLNQAWLLSPTPDWTHMILPLIYTVNDTTHPDSIQLIFLSSYISPLHRGTSLWLDSVHFDASVNIIIDTFPAGIYYPSNIRGINAYPNPANEQLRILVQQSEVGSGIQLYNEEGQQVYTAIIDRPEHVINTACLPAGVYAMRVYSRDHLTIYNGRITIIHRE